MRGSDNLRHGSLFMGINVSEKQSPFFDDDDDDANDYHNTTRFCILNVKPKKKKTLTNIQVQS